MREACVVPDRRTCRGRLSRQCRAGARKSTTKRAHAPRYSRCRQPGAIQATRLTVLGACQIDFHGRARAVRRTVCGPGWAGTIHSLPKRPGKVRSNPSPRQLYIRSAISRSSKVFFEWPNSPDCLPPRDLGVDTSIPAVATDGLLPLELLNVLPKQAKWGLFVGV